MSTVWNPPGTGTHNWNDAANWSAGVPTAIIDAEFNSSNVKTCTVNVNPVCKSLIFDSGFTGALVGANKTFSIFGSLQVSLSASPVTTSLTGNLSFAGTEAM